MKNLISLLVVILLSVSCYAQRYVGTVPKPEGPYVAFFDGHRIEGNWEILKDRKAFSERRITIDGTTYETKDIRMYSDGETTFLNIGGDFAEKIFGDKIKIYRIVYREVGVFGKGARWAINPTDYMEYGDGQTVPINSYFDIKKKLPADFKLLKGKGWRRLYESIEAYNTDGQGQIRDLEYTNVGHGKYTEKER